MLPGAIVRLDDGGGAIGNDGLLFGKGDLVEGDCAASEGEKAGTPGLDGEGDGTDDVALGKDGWLFDRGDNKGEVGC